jgi:hypothetical protein
VRGIVPATTARLTRGALLLRVPPRDLKCHRLALLEGSEAVCRATEWHEDAAAIHDEERAEAANEFDHAGDCDRPVVGPNLSLA